MGSITFKLLFLLPLTLAWSSLSWGVEGEGKPNPMAIVRASSALSPARNLFIGHNFFLRPFLNTLSDHQAMGDVWSDPEQMRYFGDGQVLSSIQITQRALRLAFLAAQDNPDHMHWSFVVRQGNDLAVAGRITFLYYNKPTTLELAYCTSPRFAGRGLAGAASLLLLQEFNCAFKATAHPENKASIAVLQRLGFKETAANVPLYGSIRNFYAFSPENEEAIAAEAVTRYRDAFSRRRRLF